MQPFTTHAGTAAPLPRTNVDTDTVIRINRLIEHGRGELGPYCFEPLRYHDDGSENPEFAPNQARYRGASILVAGDNFGCGSSREAAVWSLMDFGLRCVIAPSFGDIFTANSFQNGLLPIRLPADTVESILSELATDGLAPRISVDLGAREVVTPSGRRIGFEIDEERRDALLQGMDEIGLTLKDALMIDSFQSRDRAARPWVYGKHESNQATRLLILAGDGIGPEILQQVRRVVEWFRDSRGLPLDLQEELFGIAAWKAHGNLMPEGTWDAVTSADAILFGAIGSPEYAAIPAQARKVDQLLRMRKELDLFINFRPVRLTPGLTDASTLRPEVVEGTDMVLVRELAGGIYFGEPRGISVLPDGRRRAVNTLSYAEDEIRRIARAAFELARTRAGRVCSVDKGNVLETGALWREVVQELHDDAYPDIELSHMYVDNCAMQLVRAPKQFDVIVTENLFGDILSDCAAMIAGSLGMLPSVSMSAEDENGKRKALYEPIHGSAPDIAGKGIANPLGAILSFALCLRYTLGLPQEAARLEAAVQRAIAAGARTADIAAGGTSLSTVQMGDVVIGQLMADAG
jgi:3-isopropylmalate dehydrogenase